MLLGILLDEYCALQDGFGKRGVWELLLGILDHESILRFWMGLLFGLHLAALGRS